MQESPTLKRAALEVVWSVLLSTVKVAAVFLVLAVAWIRYKNFSGVTETPHEAAMKSDLRNLVTAQNAYFADFATFPMPKSYFSPSAGVTIEWTHVADSGWFASATHADFSLQCAIFIGNIEPPVPDAEEGRPVCHDPS